MLVRTLQVHLGGAFQFLALIQHTTMGNAGIKPDIENVGHLLILCFIHPQALENIV